MPKVTESKKPKKSHFLLFSYLWINSPLAGTESAQADPVLAVSPLNTVHCRLYTCAGTTRDEYFQLRTTRDEDSHQPWRSMLLAQKAVWWSALVCKIKWKHIFVKNINYSSMDQNISKTQLTMWIYEKVYVLCIAET